MRRRKRLLAIVIPILITLATIAGLYFFVLLPKQKSTNKNPQGPLTLEQFLDASRQPIESTEAARISESLADYSITLASPSALKQQIINQTIQIIQNGQNLSFTILDNRSLGGVNEVNPTIQAGPGSKQASTNSKAGSYIITYSNIYNGVDLAFSASSDSFLTEYEVKVKRTTSPITEIVQRLDLGHLKAEVQSDNSVKIIDPNNQKSSLVIPKPVIFEKYNHQARSYGLHYEILQKNGFVYLIKKVDTAGQDFLQQAHYPVIIQ